LEKIVLKSRKLSANYGHSSPTNGQEYQDGVISGNETKLFPTSTVFLPIGGRELLSLPPIPNHSFPARTA
jgi:hypothetical protein